MSKTRVVSIDLYELYEKRMRESIDFDSTFKKVDKELFRGLIRTILACDAVHDFLGGRTQTLNEKEKQIRNSFSGSIITSFKNDVSSNERDNITSFLGMNIFLKENFENDHKAKEIVLAIMEKLGLKQMSMSNVTKGDCSNDNSIIRMIDILSLHEYKKYDIPTSYAVLEQKNKNIPAFYSILHTKNPKFPPIRVYVDMTSSTINLTPIYASILNNERNIQNDCGGIKDLKLNYDYTSVYDPSNVETIFKGFKASGLVNQIEEDIEFIINIGQETIIKCKLEETSPSVINLVIDKFFNMEPNKGYKNLVSLSNGFNEDGTKKNSVKGIMKLINMGRGGNSDYIYRMMLPKTMGDFLQVMSFLDPKITTPKIFVTGDIICNCIASIFSKFSLGEIKDTEIPVLNGLGIYSTKIEKDTYTAVYVLTGMKRARTDFGKSVKYTDIRNLKEKLKSVGIKVTKKIKDKVVSLTKKELERKAHLFKKLQLKAKDKQIKLKNKNGKFKTKESLEKELKKKSSKKTSFG